MVSLRAEELLGEPIQPFIAQSVGIAYADGITETLRSNLLGGLGLGHDPVQALVGVGLVKYGSKLHPLVHEVGRGILKEFAASLLARYAPLFGGMAFGPGMAAGRATGDQVFGGIA